MVVSAKVAVGEGLGLPMSMFIPIRAYIAHTEKQWVLPCPMDTSCPVDKIAGRGRSTA
jgi:hypothetical protein